MASFQGSSASGATRSRRRGQIGAERDDQVQRVGDGGVGGKMWRLLHVHGPHLIGLIGIEIEHQATRAVPCLLEVGHGEGISDLLKHAEADKKQAADHEHLQAVVASPDLDAQFPEHVHLRAKRGSAGWTGIMLPAYQPAARILPPGRSSKTRPRHRMRRPA